MPVYRTILVPLDGSRFGEHALPWALSLARKLGAGLELTTVAQVEPPGLSPVGTARLPGEESRERAVSLAEGYLKEVVERVRASGFNGELGWTVLPPGNVVASLVRQVELSKADLAVLTTHGRGPVQRAWLGSVADGFIRSAPCPMLLVRPEPSEDGAEPLSLERLPYLPRRILLPLDGSPVAERLVELTPPVAEPSCTFLLMRAIPPFLPGGSPYLPHVVREAEEQEQVRAAAQEYLQEVGAPLREAGLATEVLVVTEGQPGQAIIEVARAEDADLIAMSTSGRGGVARLLLGSVADKVIRGAPCPVFLSRAPEAY
jgi:nucleotide-binding universal stress UspA family protein